jgi:ABC-type polysaccharide/polyol phosphate transport system ATPase subunit
MNAEILLFDYIIGAGDDGFQDKAARCLQELREQAQIVVLAINSSEVLRKTCNKVLWMKHGHVRALGSAEEVVNAYDEHMHGTTPVPE